LIPPGTWVLAVDFGVTNTVAAVRDEQSIEVLVVDGRPVMPSAVLLHPDGNTWSCGETAMRMSRTRLEWFEPNPKLWIPAGMIFLGGRDIPVGQAITALLRPICQQAADQHRGRPPAAYVVTHPPSWGKTRVAILLEAAAAAAAGGWPAPQPLSEPVAAAHGILGIDGLPQQARLVVLDLGGSTVDVTVVDRDGGELEVVGRPMVRDGLGGEDFDQRLARWMVAEVGAPGLYDRLASSEDPDKRERALAIRSDARTVKEALSRQPLISAQLPKSPPELTEPTHVQVSRSQLETLICGGPGYQPGLADAVEMVSKALQRAQTGPPFEAVILTGGCARIPLLGGLVHERIGRRPLTYGDPTTSVARGAAEFVWRKLDLADVAVENVLGTPARPPLLASAAAAVSAPDDVMVGAVDRLGTVTEAEMMTPSTPAVSCRIFLSYRHEETDWQASWLAEMLGDHFGEGVVFKDVDSIQPGDDFVQVITDAVGSCEVLLVLIGNRWLTITDQNERRRLDDPQDFVRLEIEAALKRNVRVVPILVQGAHMPHADDLPDSLAMLARRQAIELSPRRFKSDAGPLLKVLGQAISNAQTRAATDR